MSKYLVSAIQNLKPGSEFKLENDDYSTIEWIVIEGNAPTKSQVNAEVARLENEAATTEAAKVTAKQSAMDKLTALGLTADEVAALLP